jgi:competence protein ComEC
MRLRLLVAVSLCLATAIDLLAGQSSTKWIMLNVTPAQAQADCHLLQLPDGSNILIDAGEAADAPDVAVTLLKKLRVRRISLVVISHFHKDHYGQLIRIIKAGIVVKKVILNVPDKRSADLEIPWGCDLNDVQSVLAELRSRNIPYITPKAGDRIYECKTRDRVNVSLDVLCAYDGVHSPVGLTDVNDTSIVLRLSHGPTRALFTGDLNKKLGTYLLESGMDLRADLLKAPHHGAEGTVPDIFYAKVHPSAVLVPVSKALWLSARCMRTRNYFYNAGVPAYVAGLRGNVTVTITAKGFQIETEH